MQSLTLTEALPTTNHTIASAFEPHCLVFSHQLHSSLHASKISCSRESKCDLVAGILFHDQHLYTFIRELSCTCIRKHAGREQIQTARQIKCHGEVIPCPSRQLQLRPHHKITHLSITRSCRCVLGWLDACTGFSHACECSGADLQPWTPYTTYPCQAWIWYDWASSVYVHVCIAGFLPLLVQIIRCACRVVGISMRAYLCSLGG